MAKKAKFHPDVLADGDPFDDRERVDPDEELDPDAEDENEDDFDDDEVEDDPPAAKSSLEARLDRLERENEHLRRSIPPVEPRVKPAAKVEVEEEEPDWDSLIFANPKEALRLHGERVAKQVTRQLKGEYQQEQNRNRFWDGFYKTNRDLAGYEDIAEMVLGRNMASLANMRTEDAMNELADLTRKRILQLSGKRPRKKAIVEGGRAPSRRAAEPDKPDDNVSSISSYIRQRRAKKLNRTSAA